MEELLKNPFDLFAGVQETYEDALKKQAEENKSFAKTKHFKMDGPGTYIVRILPLAPVEQPDGTYILDRKSYEYPVKTQILKLERPSEQGKKAKPFYVPVTHSSCVGMSVDLIDTYIEVAEEKYGDDEKLIKKIKGTSFEGGLKWNRQRAMYVLDLKKRSEGIQLLTLSYSQYKDLDDSRLSVWKKLLANNPKALCPISSTTDAFPVEIVRKEENKKISYKFNIDVISGKQGLEADELQALLDAPRLPEVLYRYSRYALEATIEFLKQYDAKNEIDVMGSKTIADTIEKIKMELPADDKSHFSFDKGDTTGDDIENEENSIDSLWKRWEDLQEQGIDDKSEEGQNLRDDIRAFIDDNNLNVRVLRSKTNETLLQNIEDALENAASEDREEDAEEVPLQEPVAEGVVEPDYEEDEEESEEELPTKSKDEYNEDTNEPALGRRTARPARRRAR